MTLYTTESMLQGRVGQHRTRPVSAYVHLWSRQRLLLLFSMQSQCLRGVCCEDEYISMVEELTKGLEMKEFSIIDILST
jgi:hypothetical protein